MAANDKTPGKPEIWPSVRQDDAVEQIPRVEEAGEDRSFDPEPGAPEPEPGPARTGEKKPT
jgi:hypothetical protein